MTKFVKLTSSRIAFLLHTWPMRWKRLFRHFTYPIKKINYEDYHKPQNSSEWFSDLLCYVQDIAMVPEIYETLMDIIKWKTRSLTEAERSMIRELFGDHIQLSLIRIDNRAKVGLKKNIIAYVSFNTINSRKKISNAILMHEMVHVWQYQRFGSVYISKALHAQKKPDVYDYGGSDHLFRMMLSGKKLTDFNFEQQAEIIEDYYGFKTEGQADAMHLQAYEYFAAQLKE